MKLNMTKVKQTLINTLLNNLIVISTHPVSLHEQQQKNNIVAYRNVSISHSEDTYIL